MKFSTKFSKYSGSGNDFVFIDSREETTPFSSEMISRLCDRKNGIGADGLILLEKGQKAPFRMRIFNSDGSEAEMCGNGIRCFKKFLEECGIDDSSVVVETKERLLKVESKGVEVRAEMGCPKDLSWDIKLDDTCQIDLINTGVPHAVQFVADIEREDLFDKAPFIRYHPKLLPSGTNVNAAQIKNNELWVRTWERGVEGETLACGTGMVACALIASMRFHLPSPIIVVPRSREKIVVEFKIENNRIVEVTQTGPARFIFQGCYTYALQNNQKVFC